MINVTRTNLLTTLSEEDSFSLKIIADRYLLKDTEKIPAKNDVVTVELVIEGNEEGKTVKEVAIVDSYNADTQKLTVTLFTGGDERGKQFTVDKSMTEVLLETDVAQLQKRLADTLGDDNDIVHSELLQRSMKKIIFGGRILTGAGTQEELTYFNCYVAPLIHDSRGGIADHRKLVGEIMARGGGVGTNLSTLRPSKTKVHKVRGRSSGSVSWGDDISRLTDLTQQGGSRRGAQMLMLCDWHPDIIEFITAKAQKPLKATVRINGEEKLIKFGSYGNKRLTGANISVLFSDAFMEAVKLGKDWELVFPDVANYTKSEMEVYDEVWHTIGNPYEFQKQTGMALKTYAVVPARDIRDLFGVAMHGSAEPGAFFIDRANHMSNSWYFNPIIATNPCGEEPLPAWAVCNLGHVNLAEHAEYIPELGKFQLNFDDLETSVRVLSRALDRAIDKTPYFFEANRKNQQGERRLGLGTMGIDELLKLEGLDYGTPEGRERAEEILEFVTVIAYSESIAMARDKGAFEFFDAPKFLQSGFIKFLGGMYPAMVKDIERFGIRNVVSVTQAPTGTTGTMVQTSTGIEPFYAGEFYRMSRIGLTKQTAPVIKKLEAHGMDTSKLKYAGDYSAKQHLDFQAVAQKWCDSSISKTINAPANTTVEEVNALLEYAYEIGLKGFTVYVDGSRSEQVLSTDDTKTVAEQEMPMSKYHAHTTLSAGEVALGFENDKLKRVVIDVERLSEILDGQGVVEHLSHLLKVAMEAHGSTDCAECGAPLIFAEGCFKCEACGFSKCG